VVRGAKAVVEQALTFTKLAPRTQRAIVNGAAGVVTVVGGQVFAVMGVTIRDDKITEIYILADPVRINRLNLTFN
jgi:RNA polymerase sigma-70 factor (ECF subfamily)